MNLFHLNLFLWDRNKCSGLERKHCSGLDRKDRSDQEANPAELRPRFRQDHPLVLWVILPSVRF